MHSKRETTRLAGMLAFIMATVVVWPLVALSDWLDRSPEEKLGDLLNNRHALILVAEETSALLREVTAKPELYLKLLRQKAALPLERGSSGDYGTEQKSVEHAVMLLARVKLPGARKVILDQFRQIRKRVAAMPPTAGTSASLEGSLRNHYRFLVDTLWELKDPAIITEALADLEGADLPTEVILLRYLVDVGGDDPRVAAKLRRLFESRSSRLKGDLLIDRALAYLTESRPKK